MTPPVQTKSQKDAFEFGLHLTLITWSKYNIQNKICVCKSELGPIDCKCSFILATNEKKSNVLNQKGAFKNLIRLDIES